MNLNTETQLNHVNGCSSLDGAASRSRSPVAQSEPDQAGIGPHPTTGQIRESAHQRRKFSRFDNSKILGCYNYGSNPGVRGYIKRMAALWQEGGSGMALTQQRLADQARVIIRNKWFTNEELDEIKESMKWSNMVEQSAMSDHEHYQEITENQTEVHQSEVRRDNTEVNDNIIDCEILSKEEKELVLKVRSMREELDVNREPITSLRNLPAKKVKEEVRN